MNYLPDTSIYIDLIKQKPPHIQQQFQQYQIGEIGLSSVTVAEL